MSLEGRHLPRIHTPWVEGNSRGQEVIDLAEKLGTPLLPWQQVVVKDLLSVDENNKPLKRTAGIMVARQNGKTHLARMIILWALLDGKRVLGMASKRALAEETWRMVKDIILEHEWLTEQLSKKPREANGQERMEFKGGGKYEIAAATRDATRGKTVDLLFIDELREIGVDAWTAARPTTRATGGMTLVTSNAGDAFSEVLNELRERALSYPSKTLGWYEYSAPQHCAIDDREAWRYANPALGHLIDEETIEEAVATNSVESTRTEVLCQWISSLSSPWTIGSIEACCNSELVLSPLSGATVMAFDISVTRRNASLVAGIIQSDGKIGVGVMEQWTSEVAVDELEIAKQIHAWCQKYRPRSVLYDKYTTATVADRLAQSGIMVADCSGQKFYQACSDLKDSFDNSQLVHSGQESLVDSLNNCASKQNDSGWRIIRRKSAGDVTAAIALAMVVHEMKKPLATPKIFMAQD